MKPDDRLDQLEPLMADELQKIDRLIEGQGKLVDLATKTDQKANTTAKGVGNLTLKVNQIADNQTQLTLKINQIADDQTQLTLKVDQIADDQSQSTLKVNQIADDQSRLRQEVNQGFSDMNQRFEQLVTLIQERLK